MTDEKGYIKFHCNWIKSEPVAEEIINDLNHWREKLFNLGLIGAYQNGIGYGNLSIRIDNDSFLITGTATGHLTNLTTNHFTKVTSYSFEKNSLNCTGPIKASSESLTHAAIYESENNINAVIHVHSKVLWNRLRNSVPATAPNIEYGTSQMAEEIKRLFKQTNVFEEKILVMTGHEDGIITFGKTIEEAGNIILKYLSI